ncbi:MAG: hypothetical protein ACLT0Y_08555 [Christensenellales bacterium]
MVRDLPSLSAGHAEEEEICELLGKWGFAPTNMWIASERQPIRRGNQAIEIASARRETQNWPV